MIASLLTHTNKRGHRRQRAWPTHTPPSPMSVTVSPSVAPVARLLSRLAHDSLGSAQVKQL